MHINNEKLRICQDCYSFLESPIEKMMYANMVTVSSICSSGIVEREFKKHSLRRAVTPQEEIGDYRVDMLVKILDDKDNIFAQLIIECDGHEYHNLTKEQAQRDRKRDRVLQSLGYAVFRFTGSEIFNNGMECAAECFEYLYTSAFKNIKTTIKPLE